MGMHADAKNRYPEGFGVFSEKDVDRDDLNKRERRRVAEYDNSVLYNDLVISNIISTLRDKNAIMFRTMAKIFMTGKNPVMAALLGTSPTLTPNAIFTAFLFLSGAAILSRD